MDKIDYNSTRIVIAKHTGNMYCILTETFPFMHQDRLSYHMVVLSDNLDDEGNPEKSILTMAATDISEMISPYTDKEYQQLVETKKLAISFLRENQENGKETPADQNYG